MSKIRKEFWLTDEEIDYIEKYKSSHCCKSPAQALSEMIRENKNASTIKVDAQLATTITKSIVEELNKTLTRIRLGVNNADRNSDLILDLLNTLVSYSGFKTLIEKETPQLEKAKANQQEKLAYYRTKKLSREVSSPVIFDFGNSDE